MSDLSIVLSHCFIASIGFMQGQMMTHEQCDSSMIAVAQWNDNATCWDSLMGEGSPFQREIVDRALMPLLPKIGPENRVFEIACGNGFLSRRLATMGAEVYAVDSSTAFINLARLRTTPELHQKIHYQVADATKSETYEMFQSPFDCIICNMACMDIADIDPIFHGASKLLNKHGSLIITQTHPCFEKAVGPLFHDNIGGEQDALATSSGIKVLRYLTPYTMITKAVPSLPSEHPFFHRSLSTILHAAFQAGLVVDGLEEVAFPKNSALSEHNGWHHLHDIPVVIGIRFRKALDSVNQ